MMNGKCAVRVQFSLARLIQQITFLRDTVYLNWLSGRQCPHELVFDRLLCLAHKMIFNYKRLAENNRLRSVICAFLCAWRIAF